MLEKVQFITEFVTKFFNLPRRGLIIPPPHQKLPVTKMIPERLGSGRIGSGPTLFRGDGFLWRKGSSLFEFGFGGKGLRGGSEVTATG